MQETFIDYTVQSFRAPPVIREAVGVFKDQHLLDQAIEELEKTAFPRHDISILAHGSKRGVAASSSRHLEDHPEAPRSISVRPEEKTIGTAALIGGCAYVCGIASALMVGVQSSVALVTAITLGSIAGAMFGAGIALVIWKKYKSEAKQRIAKGGLILWVRTPDLEKERLAQDIMRKNGAVDVHIHTIQ